MSVLRGEPGGLAPLSVEWNILCVSKGEGEWGSTIRLDWTFMASTIQQRRKWWIYPLLLLFSQTLGLHLFFLVSVLPPASFGGSILLSFCLRTRLSLFVRHQLLSERLAFPSVALAIPIGQGAEGGKHYEAASATILGFLSAFPFSLFTAKISLLTDRSSQHSSGIKIDVDLGAWRRSRGLSFFTGRSTDARSRHSLLTARSEKVAEEEKEQSTDIRPQHESSLPFFRKSIVAARSSRAFSSSLPCKFGSNKTTDETQIGVSVRSVSRASPIVAAAKRRWWNGEKVVRERGRQRASVTRLLLPSFIFQRRRSCRTRGTTDRTQECRTSRRSRLTKESMAEKESSAPAGQNSRPLDASHVDLREACQRSLN